MIWASMKIFLKICQAWMLKTHKIWKIPLWKHVSPNAYNLFTDVNSNMMRVNQEKWINCKSDTSLKMLDNSIKCLATMQKDPTVLCQVKWSSMWTKCPQYFSQNQVFLILYLMYDSTARHWTIVLSNSTIYRVLMPI